MRRKWAPPAPVPLRFASLALVAALGAGLLVGCGGTTSPAPVARAYLAAWAAGDDAGAARRTDDEVGALAALKASAASLGVTSMRVTTGKITTRGPDATAEFTATVVVPGLGTWTHAGRLPLVRVHGRWVVHWTSQDIDPHLVAGTHLALTRSLPPRAALEDDSGHALFAARPVVQIGIEPDRVHGHLATTLSAVARAVGVQDVAALRAAVLAASPSAFVPVITLRRAAYEKVKAQIYSLPGTVFVASTELLPPTTGFGQALLGTIGPATADVLRAAGPGYRAGDVLGLSGLQAHYQQRLAGSAGGSVVVEDRNGVVTATLVSFAAHPGTPVRTTIDTAVQLAAEAALAHETQPAALVAVRASDGAILAVANAPDATSYDRALEGHYAPGSTFKMVTTYALLGRGVTPSTRVACRPSVVVDGKAFRNFEGEASASAAFATDFAQSCNTAFIAAASRLADGDLATAASALGVAAPWALPVAAFSGAVPPATSPVERAADAIGQGTVSVSPLTMALVASAIDSGRVPSPALVTSPAAPASPGRPLDPARVATLRSLMRLVVTSGTAAHAGLPPGTFGKTGTAEFGTANPPQTHAWFAGFRGDVAFAVIVEGGGVGGAVAAPIAAVFLRGFPASL
jgi:cell division protein FtsI/penicillin-binding protein 2